MRWRCGRAIHRMLGTRPPAGVSGGAARCTGGRSASTACASTHGMGVGRKPSGAPAHVRRRGTRAWALSGVGAAALPWRRACDLPQRLGEAAGAWDVVARPGQRRADRHAPAPPNARCPRLPCAASPLCAVLGTDGAGGSCGSRRRGGRGGCGTRHRLCGRRMAWWSVSATRGRRGGATLASRGCSQPWAPAVLPPGRTTRPGPGVGHVAWRPRRRWSRPSCAWQGTRTSQRRRGVVLPA